MYDISQETLKDFCRACLKRLKRQKCCIQSLDLHIRQWLGDVAVDNPLVADTYPNSICRSCQNKLKNLLEFRQMCVRSRKKIEDILKNKNGDIKNPTEYQATLPVKNDGPKESHVEHFLRIDVVDNQDVDCTIKSEAMQSNFEVEPMISNIKPTDIKDMKDEPKIAEINFLTYFKNYADEKEKKNSSNKELCHSGYKNTDIDSYVANNKQYYTSLDESSNEGNSNKKNSQNANKPAAKRKKYIYTFRCDQCKYRAVSQQTLDIHKRTHFGLKPYQCTKCDQEFDKSNQMLKHLNEIHGEKKLTIACEHEDCGKKFKSNRSYKEHYRQNHIPEEKPLEKTDKHADKSPYKHICEECGKIYTKLQVFKEHKYTHGPKELYPFQCTECDKAFINPRTFKEHQQRHAGIRNFECSYCGAKKTTKKELRSHLNSHTKEKKYPCPNCSLIFYRTTNLRVHVEVVHMGIRRFACRYCDQTFGKGDNLKHHELLHTGEKPHVCNECGKRFVQKVSLRLHMKTHNK